MSPITPRLTIKAAHYGAAGDDTKVKDVTREVRKHLSEDGQSLHMVADNEMLECNPAHWRRKELKVWYTTYEGGRELCKTVSEGEELDIKITPGLHVASAHYRSADADDTSGSKDVTDLVRDAVAPDGQSVRLTVSNDTMGADPAFMRGKQLEVEYETFEGGPKKHAKIQEHGVLELRAGLAE